MRLPVKRYVFLLIILLFPTLIYYCLNDSFSTTINELTVFEDTLEFSNLKVPYKLHFKPILSTKPELLAIIYSHSGSFETRQTIRQTWLKTKTHKIKHYFFLSNLPHDKYNNRESTSFLDHEISAFDDIIVSNLTDTYENLVFKVFQSFRFQITFFPAVKYFAKIDDDTIVHLDRILTWSRYIFDQTGNENAIFCYVWFKAMVHRNGTDKFNILKDSYPLEQYPKYCNGPCYVLTNVAIKNIVQTSLHSNLISFEDVFITGILAVSSKTRLLHKPMIISAFMNEKVPMKSRCRTYSSHSAPFLSAITGYKLLQDIRLKYNQLLALPCKLQSKIKREFTNN